MQSTFTKTNPKIFRNKRALAQCAGNGSAIAIAIQMKYEAGVKKYEVKNEH